MSELALPEYPHRYPIKLGQASDAMALVMWCVRQFGYADYCMQYDQERRELYMHATGNNNGWYPQGYQSINFREASDLILFKLTFGNG